MTVEENMGTNKKVKKKKAKLMPNEMLHNSPGLNDRLFYHCSRILQGKVKLKSLDYCSC